MKTGVNQLPIMGDTDTKCPDLSGHKRDPFPRSPMRFSINPDSLGQGAPPSSTVDHLVRIKRCASQLVQNCSSKILQLYGVQLVMLGTSFDPEIGCEYVIYRLEDAVSQKECPNEQQQRPTVITAYSVQVSIMIYVFSMSSILFSY